MKIRILSVSKIREDFIRKGEDEYLKRLKSFVQLERIEIGADFSSSLSETQILAKEAELILSKLKKDEFLIILDENGKDFTSHEFASYLDDKMLHGVSNFCFVIGGAFGLDKTVKKEAGLLLSLSHMTFPYQISHLLLIEQLYRAFTVIKGIPYHK